MKHANDASDELRYYNLLHGCFVTPYHLWTDAQREVYQQYRIQQDQISIEQHKVLHTTAQRVTRSQGRRTLRQWWHECLAGFWGTYRGEQA